MNALLTPQECAALLRSLTNPYELMNPEAHALQKAAYDSALVKLRQGAKESAAHLFGCERPKAHSGKCGKRLAEDVVYDRL